MTTFEYRTLVSHWSHDADTTRLSQTLNALGAEGWELAGMTRDESPDDEAENEAILMIFKRPKGAR
ncbi:MAG TPA: DUF4177 domain-containing protein [Bdellovibrionales bacterium]|nr:DUF4177 domain-containing protein [Bdellovibrionales bacterium]